MWLQIYLLYPISLCSTICRQYMPGLRWSSLMPCHAGLHCISGSSGPSWRQMSASAKPWWLRHLQGLIYDLKLNVARGEIPFAGSHPVRYLGRTIQVSQNPALAWEVIRQAGTATVTGWCSSCNKERETEAILSEICPGLLWNLTISEFSVSWLENCLIQWPPNI